MAPTAGSQSQPPFSGAPSRPARRRSDRAEIYVPRDGNLGCIGSATSSGNGTDRGVAISASLLGRAFETGETQIESEGHVVVLALPSTEHLAGILVCIR